MRTDDPMPRIWDPRLAFARAKLRAKHDAFTSRHLRFRRIRYLAAEGRSEHEIADLTGESHELIQAVLHEDPWNVPLEAGDRGPPLQFEKRWPDISVSGVFDGARAALQVSEDGKRWDTLMHSPRSLTEGGTFKRPLRDVRDTPYRFVRVIVLGGGYFTHVELSHS
jgi:hypothetical protein